MMDSGYNEIMCGLWAPLKDMQNKILRASGSYKKEKRVANAEANMLYVIAAYRQDVREIERVMNLYANCVIVVIINPEDLIGREVKHYILSDRAHLNPKFGEIMDVLNTRIR